MIGFEKFKDVKFKPESLTRIEQCNAIVQDYQGQGLRLTLRQLYYQLVTKNLIPNVERSYKNLSSLVSDARLAGLMRWDAIEDRVRVPRQHSEYDNLGELVEAALYSYRLPRWQDQPYYAELWVEKDALAGVLEPLSEEYHVTLMVNRGYSSQSAMYEAAKRFIKRTDQHWYDDAHTEAQREREGILFYLGDHDPSGEDMVRDIAERLAMFGVYQLKVEKLALTPKQIKKYRPPPNPAKLTDPRAEKYIEAHGDQSWEVDALPPEVLTKIIRTAFDGIIERDRMDKIIEKEEDDKDALSKAVENIMTPED